MQIVWRAAASLFLPALFCAQSALCTAQTATLSGKVVDESGVPVSGAEILLTSVVGEAPSPLAQRILSDDVGRVFLENLPPGDYRVTIRKLGFFLLSDQSLTLHEGANEVSFALAHEQELHEKVEVSSRAGQLEPEDTAQRSTLIGREIRDVPVPSSHDLISSLVILPDVVRDNAGGLHVAGARTGETQYLLDGFEFGDPASGDLNGRFNVDATRLVEAQPSRFSGSYAHPGAGILSLDTISGDDRWRFGTTNFVPGIRVERGWHFGNWYPRFQFSGPLAKGHAWFSEAVSLQHSLGIVKEQPPGQDSTAQWAGQSLTRLQWNLAPRHILSANYLYNREDESHRGLDAFDPISTTLDANLERSFVSLKDQYWLHSTLFMLGVAADGSVLNELPQGTAPYVLFPQGASGNFFESLHRRVRRLQAIGSVTTAERHWHGSHELTAGFNMSGLALSQSASRGEIDVKRGDSTLARRSTFTGSPDVRVTNSQAGGYAQDTWTITRRLILQAGVREDWDRLVQHAMAGPHAALNILPLHEDTAKLSLGWSLTNAPLDLTLLGQAFDQLQVDTLYDATGQNAIAGPVTSRFVLPAGGLKQPRFATTSAGWQQKIAMNTLVGLELLARNEQDGLVHETQQPGTPGGIFLLTNHRRDKYRAATLTARHSFGQRAEIFGSYTRSRANTSAVINAFLGPLQFVPEQGGPLRWDTPNRLLTWGWTQTRIWGLFLSYLFEYRTGFPFSSVDQYLEIVGAPNRQRFPDHANLNLGIEKRFQFRGYYWAFRVSAVNVIGRENPDVVINDVTAPNYLQFAGGHGRAFTARLRFVGRK